MEIKEIKQYICPETGKKFGSRSAAEKSARAAIQSKRDIELAAEQKKLADQLSAEQKDFIRLNVSSVDEIPRLIEQKTKEFWGIDCKIDMNVRFGNVSNSHDAPLGKLTNWRRDINLPKSYLGWSGKITGELINYRCSKMCSESVSSVLFNQYDGAIGFRGFHTGGGCPGSVNGLPKMEMVFYFFLDDFPKLKEIHEFLFVEREKEMDNQCKINELYENASNFAELHPDVFALYNQIDELTQKLNKLKLDHRENYMKENPVKLVDIHPDFNKLKGQFGSFFTT